jgi:hypothetical protein
VCVPPKIQLFLWLLAYNKLATVDNLNRKEMSKPIQCCFCAENENIDHLFFRVCGSYRGVELCMLISGDRHWKRLSISCLQMAIKRKMLLREYYIHCCNEGCLADKKQFYLS